ncbi:MAG: hypothetical protein GC204_02710 [Chloroflexi bacterium]|nr:hypothetical protein [Chloroflexota bacterium]
MSAAPITHVFFEVPGVLVDRAALRQRYRANLGRIMAERYGGDASAWSVAYDEVLADWDSYYADLNLSGEDGLADASEGRFRTTRALFRLKERPEPNQAELTALAQELPALASANSAALYPEVPTVLRPLDEAGLVLGVISYSLSGVLEALLEPVLPHFKGAIWGIDRAEQFDKDVQRYQLAALSAQVKPERCLVVDDEPLALMNAEQAGMQTFKSRGAAGLRGLAVRWMQAASTPAPL